MMTIPFPQRSDVVTGLAPSSITTSQGPARAKHLKALEGSHESNTHKQRTKMMENLDLMLPRIGMDKTFLTFCITIMSYANKLY